MRRSVDTFGSSNDAYMHAYLINYALVRMINHNLLYFHSKKNLCKIFLC